MVQNQTFQAGCGLYVRTSMQKTLIIFKPDCMQQRHVGNVLNRFEQAGFAIVGCKMMQLTPAILREHYAHVADKPFYPQIEEFMSSQPVVVMALQGDQVVQSIKPLEPRASRVNHRSVQVPHIVTFASTAGREARGE